MGAYGEATVLFDMDGVLVDSGESIVRGLTSWALERGLDVDTVLAHAHGRTDADLIRLVAPHLDPYEESERVEAHESGHNETVQAVPGALELLTQLHGRDRPWAVVTSAGRALARSRLKVTGLPLPHVLVGADDVPEGKPHPAPYLLGAEHMERAPEQCVVVEDSPNGVRAGLAAGIPVVAVATTTDPAQLTHATHVVDDVTAAARLLLE